MAAPRIRPAWAGLFIDRAPTGRADRPTTPIARPTHPDVGVEDGFFNWYAALRNGGLVAALGEVVAKYPGRPLKLNAHSA